ncbi:carotenoid biosynthesis protein [uncultured Anaerococcus sp.]|uniref:carotenoid biosynthesis protein n=1 Tax=uncultured Anaerococcus sp. TaxID=293428 RepID=UPI002805368B|nr:carotenoid biosynthesis protein [uncultured Anaerococcus sp.]
MNWINSFELICYFIVILLVVDIYKSRNYREFGLLISGALAGFSLELLAVRLTDIYHYSDDFFISIGFRPYQFPFFGGLMWGGITVCALRIARKFHFNKLMTALFAGWLIVSMDLLLDVVAIRLDGGFWVWDGREINLAINHHMFMSVIWVNFLGYIFEVPSIVYMTLKSWEKENNKSKINLGKSLLIGSGGVIFVGICSYLALFLDKISNEWFSCIAFCLLRTFIFIKLLAELMRNREKIRLAKNKDWTLIIFWFAIYAYCIVGLIKLGIVQAIPIYGIFAIFLFALTIFLALINIEKEK